MVANPEPEDASVYINTQSAMMKTYAARPEPADALEA
jgi:hypothetical protein